MRTIYRYGLMAWIWRTLIAGPLMGGAICLVGGARLGEPTLLFMAVVLLTPALFFGAVVAVRVDVLDDAHIRIWTLLFWRRRLPRSRLGKSRLRTSYQNETGPLYAPRLWVSVHKSLPIYFDLFAEIPDRRAFAALFQVPTSALPGKASEEELNGAP